jgi:hypothetical protein
MESMRDSRQRYSTCHNKPQDGSDQARAQEDRDDDDERPLASRQSLLPYTPQHTSSTQASQGGVGLHPPPPVGHVQLCTCPKEEASVRGCAIIYLGKGRLKP